MPVLRKRKRNVRCRFILMGLALAVSAAAAFGAEPQMAQSGSGRYRSARSAVVDIMAMGPDRLQINFDETGVVVEAPDDSPFIDASFHTMGTIHVIEKQLTYTGAALWTRPDGDQIFGVFSGEGARGVGTTKGFLELVGGTGTCSGIRGSLTFQSGPYVRSS